MKRNMLFGLLLIFCFVILCTGCTDNAKAEQACVKCGNTATTVLSGPADIMTKNGISIADCKQVTSIVYSAPICDSCLGPVAKIKTHP